MPNDLNVVLRPQLSTRGDTKRILAVFFDLCETLIDGAALPQQELSCSPYSGARAPSSRFRDSLIGTDTGCSVRLPDIIDDITNDEDTLPTPRMLPETPTVGGKLVLASSAVMCPQPPCEGGNTCSDVVGAAKDPDVERSAPCGAKLRERLYGDSALAPAPPESGDGPVGPNVRCFPKVECCHGCRGKSGGKGLYLPAPLIDDMIVLPIVLAVPTLPVVVPKRALTKLVANFPSPLLVAVPRSLPTSPSVISPLSGSGVTRASL